MVSFLVQEMAYGFQQLMDEQSFGIVYRDVTTGSGPVPGTNPPLVDTPVVAGGTGTLGSTVLNIAAASANGALIVGDEFVLDNDPIPSAPTIYTVSARVVADGTEFTAVHFAPPIAFAAPDGTGLSLNYIADWAFPALVTSFPTRLINGSTIMEDDLQVRFSAADGNMGGAVPEIGDQVFVHTHIFQAVNVHDLDVQGEIYGYLIHVRR